MIEADPTRVLPAVDPKNRELLLSLGAFAQNLALAAGSMGYKVQLRVLNEDPFARDFIRLTFKSGPKTGYPLARLANRRTMRHGHLPREITARHLRTLLGPRQQQAVYFPRDSEHARCMQEAAVETFRIQSRRDEAQKELVRWLRLSHADARRQRDGLTVAGMEIQGIKGWFVRHFAKPQDFIKSKFRQQGVDQVAALADQGAGWIVITSPGRTVADLIETGRRFENMALLARELNIAIHPMTQILEEQQGQSLIDSRHGAEIIPQFILRVGYCDHYPRPVSLRRPVGAFTYRVPVMS